jgi:1A family penicillin-binding protein
MALRKRFKKIYSFKAGSRTVRIIRYFIAGLFLATLACATAGIGVYIYFAKDLPLPEKFAERDFAQSTKIYDRTGKVLLYELYGEEKREVVPFTQISDNLKRAVLSAEDSNFYHHSGLDYRGILRSILNDLKFKNLTYGGSTISQQLIRSTFLNTEKTIKRKVKELILTVELEKRYSKDQIFEWYLNQIPFGPNIYGVETASQAYFSKPASELTVSEAAALAAMIKTPSYFYPYGAHKTELLARKDYVIDRMAQENYISKEDAEKYKKEELKFSDPSQNIKAPHFTLYVQDYLFSKYGEDFLETKGLKIYTTLDWDLQQAAEEAVKKGVEKNHAYNGYNAALVSTDPKTGEILAMVGSADWFGDPLPKGCSPGVSCKFDPKVNVAAYQSGRQPGSSFKPYVYATAFEKGYDDKYVVTDEFTDFGIYGGEHYTPQNYDGKFRGPVTLRNALAQSLNIPAVKVLMNLAGLNDSLATAQKMGITTLGDASKYGPALVLGGGEVKLIDMVSAYGVFATEGYKISPSSILRIEDANGNIIEENEKSLKKVLTNRTCQLINSILSDNEARTPIFGSHSIMYFEGQQVAAKTGTTGDYRDGWIIGYTPSLVAGVWAGNNNNEPMYKETGLFMAGPIWRAYVDKALIKFPKETFSPIEAPSQNP